MTGLTLNVTGRVWKPFVGFFTMLEKSSFTKRSKYICTSPQLIAKLLALFISQHKLNSGGGILKYEEIEARLKTLKLKEDVSVTAALEMMQELEICFSVQEMQRVEQFRAEQNKKKKKRN